MKSLRLLRNGLLPLLLVACDQHTPVLNEKARVDLEHERARLEVQTTEQTLISLGANQAYAFTAHEQQFARAQAAKVALQQEIDTLKSHLETAEKSLTVMKAKVTAFKARQTH